MSIDVATRTSHWQNFTSGKRPMVIPKGHWPEKLFNFKPVNELTSVSARNFTRGPKWPLKTCFTGQFC